jgi:hypothetical protein
LKEKAFIRSKHYLTFAQVGIFVEIRFLFFIGRKKSLQPIKYG